MWASWPWRPTVMQRTSGTEVNLEKLLDTWAPPGIDGEHVGGEPVFLVVSGE